ncbi:NF-kappa-B-repressing factor [Ascaphus truei]|uniref:NF-kappa-B-repressing factor n=1 Tax=Ascaphus truei TaxID=8439 RepID=UPI003F5A4C7D
MASHMRYGPDPGQSEGLPVWSLEDFRQYQESDKQWAARRQFLARHLQLYPGHRVEQLIALSVVWVNIVFMGNRYGELLTQKVHEMAEGIDVGEMPSYELVPGAKAAKRQGTSEVDEQPQKKKIGSRFGPRPRFEPVHFVVSSTKEDDNKMSQVNNGLASQKQSHYGDSQTSNSISNMSSASVISNDASQHAESSESQQNPFIYDSLNTNTTNDQSKSESGNFMTKMEQNYSAKFESHCSTLSKNFRANVLDMWTEVNKQGRKGFGFVKPPKRTGKFVPKFRGNGRSNAAAHVSHILDRPTFMRELCAVVIENMSKPKMSMNSKQINYTFMLTRSIQACSTNPEYIYVSLKEIPPADLPKHRKLPSDGYACEVRCQDVYLATGYSGSKNGARDRAAEQAIQLLQRPVEIMTVNRKFGHTYREDLVAYPSGVPMMEFPPALKQQNDGQGSDGATSWQQSSDITRGVSTKPWTEFILTENASDAIGILNNSASHNKMTVEYKYDMMPSNAWRCSVYVQDHCVAEGYGNKKHSKHAAAEEAVNILKTLQANLQKGGFAQTMNNAPIKNLSDLVVYENASNPVCTLNDTAQFNKVTVEYVFERMTGINWKCKVFMDQQFVAEALGVKKTVKHIAAEEAVKVLKRTQPLVVNNLKKAPIEDAISRNQIRGWSAEEAYKQQIKEDNIGNQLLRKMGWTGGGLGKEGEGIAEPISVKEQFSREGLGLITNSNHRITKRDIDQIIRNYAASYNQDDLTFSRELTNEERRHIHQVSQKYGLKSKSHGQGNDRFLVVSRKRNKQDLIDQLKQEGQVGCYELVMPPQQ